MFLRFSPFTLSLLFTLSFAQVLPDGVSSSPFVCPPSEHQAEIRTEADREEQAIRAKYREVLPAYLTALGGGAPTEVLMPVIGTRVSDVTDTWGAARSNGRAHEGQDIFAPRGTDTFAATEGYVYRIGLAPLGGKVITIVGAGGYRYYYAHLDNFAADLLEGQFVTSETLIGYVGNTGNAQSTPPHLHFGIYIGDDNPCSWNAINPYPLLANRRF